MKSLLHILLMSITILALASCNGSAEEGGSASQDVEKFQYYIEVDDDMYEAEKWVISQYNHLIAGVDSIEAIKRDGELYDDALISVISRRYDGVIKRVGIYGNFVDSVLYNNIFYNIDRRFRAFNDVPVGGDDSVYVRVYIAPGNARFYKSGDCVDFNDFFGMIDANTDWNYTELDDEMFQYLDEEFGIQYDNERGGYVVK